MTQLASVVMGGMCTALKMFSELSVSRLGRLVASQGEDVYGECATIWQTKTEAAEPSVGIG